MVSENFRDFPISKNARSALSDAQHAAVAMLAMGKSFPHVAEEVKVDVRTIYNWRKLPAFRRALRKRREEIWHESADRLRAMLTRSLDIVEEQLAVRYEPSRVRAANMVLRHTGVRAAIDPTRTPSRSKRAASAD
jgi:hypothetical protein